MKKTSKNILFPLNKVNAANIYTINIQTLSIIDYNYLTDYTNDGNLLLLINFSLIVNG